MSATPETPVTRPITVAIAALGGQGGGVLADWLVEVAQSQDWIVQSTSVPGVAQRTGTTVYYVEMAPKPAAGQRAPVMALMPVPGDVQLVVAAELMEAGRAVVRGIVTPDRTTLVASSHRVYGITEKSNMGDGIADANAVLAALHSQSRRLVCFDMETLAQERGSVISSVLFGAIAASAALPFPRAAYEQAITKSGVAVKASLAAFAAGFDRALQTAPVAGVVPPSSDPTTAQGRELDEQIKRDFPAHLHGLIREGVKRMLDYQDADYARWYLQRLGELRNVDAQHGAAGGDYSLTGAVARHLALWMAYEDTIRVADLKTRGSRFERFRDDVKADAGQIVDVVEFMHPRFQEICETLPAGLGQRLLDCPRAQRWSAPLFRKGRLIKTTRVTGFVMLYFMAGLRRWRRGTLRYRVEQERIDGWLARITRTVGDDYALAVEIAQCQRVIKGYSDTHERGLRSYHSIMAAVDAHQGRDGMAATVKRLRDAALADEEGVQLRAALEQLAAGPAAAQA